MDGLNISYEANARARGLLLQQTGGSGKPPRSVLIGAESLLVECAAILQQNGHAIAAVVAPSGPAADWAASAGHRLFHRAGELIDSDIGPIDYLFSITNLSILAPDVLRLARRAAVNFHDGPLPHYAGLNTPVWAMLAGEPRHGVTWHRMTEAVDGGDILASEAIEIEPGETAVSLNTKCFAAGMRSFAWLAANLDDALRQACPQQGKPMRWFDRKDRPTAAATIDWSMPAEEIHRLVCALDHGLHSNPLGVPKALLGETLVLVEEVEVLVAPSTLPPGTLVASSPIPRVSTGNYDVLLTRIARVDGEPITSLEASPGDRFAVLDEEARSNVSALDAAAAHYENWWRKQLSERDCLHLPHFRLAPANRTPLVANLDESLPPGLAGRDLLAAFVAYLARVADRDVVDIGYADHVHFSRLEGARHWFADQLPLRVKLDWEQPLFELADGLSNRICQMHKHVAVAADLPARCPELRGRMPLAHPICVQMVDDLDAVCVNPGTVLTVGIAIDGRSCRWTYDRARLDEMAALDLCRGFGAFLESLAAAPGAPIGWLPLLTKSERRRVVEDWNLSTAQVPSAAGVHQLISQQVTRSPDRVAVISRGRSISYAELDARSNRLARHLAALGVGPGGLVGLSLDRSIDLPVALLAIHKAGGAYVPLDPAYPAARLKHMIDDAKLPVIVTREAFAAALPSSPATVVRIDTDRADFEHLSPAAFDGGAGPGDLAYAIYTSGSTGLPKGVMVEHRNLLNFFAGMDAKLEPDGTWLAVTSPNFDISVLELLWPLTRGYRVVVATEREIRGEVHARASRELDFSLFYFASADNVDNADQYRLLLEGAKFADANGFEAVWTPERHFHPFGGLYPNPSVTSAALATCTRRVKIRAGSVVAPLHHPARIAEEWSLVDNLSNGRTGIAFASGWQPDDFLLRPENFADRNEALMRCIADVRALWRGERRRFPGPLGRDVEIGIYPRPVQPELPFWITAAGNPETFAAAGRAGAFVLTHLLGQSVAEVGEKLETYRRAWREAGHPGEGHATLMLHSFIGDSMDQVRSAVREPLIEYLRTSTNLLKQYAWSFPAFKRPGGSDVADPPDLAALTAEETEGLLEHAFDRYFESSGLFGTPESCADLVARLRTIGVDEIGCLIDFGIPTTTALAHLPHLDALRRLANGEAGTEEMNLPELIRAHGVTHLQCTPSLAHMLVSTPASRDGLRSLRRLMVGGEALSSELAQDLSALVGGTVMNMYGPTETTIWSAVHSLEAETCAPPLGRPLANQQIYLVDRRLELVRPGTPGELVIGGGGVVRGYLNRPQLTDERFVADPFTPGGRLYRTGDLARQRDDGTIEFLGRLDHQVKIRGYRIELGEIEAALLRHPEVREAVALARGSGEDIRLIGYCIAPELRGGQEALREHLRSSLPEFMVPASIVLLDKMPRTPNGKTDRNALPDLDPAVEAGVMATAPGADPLQEQILAVWRDVLKLPHVSLKDNFFDIGGHSLLALQVHRRLAASIDRPLLLTDIFRFPTIERLSRHLAGEDARPTIAPEGQERARSRQIAVRRRAGIHALARN
ncbi:MAG: LLM class flavin-dependent oxidoreductase [Sphingomonas sp.]|uniref:MupA/Atu3671 family FMN-dependent luciferase-like monooxygenase n=1 Tax=Sphingomonas sp. TaxID=28214 RepID=UPI001B0BDE63|nr:MupA/Atu3671 family FMN-dependent luciferase-like monooxygenase [Sphingomonas sp.]MBO9623885.1 LLM class flavin-dependent oxidoreductase [Sphingomonas sp.]